MTTTVASTSNSRTFDPTAPPLPSRWLDCPRRSTIIANLFIAFKTPLDDRYKDKIDLGHRWTCSILVTAVQNLGLVIDLTYTDRFYNSDAEFKNKQIRYEKIRCRGHGETPSDEQIECFIQLCKEFSSINPNKIIGVHCTHGFNRTGFLICAYLCREKNMSINDAIDLFSKARQPGIYKQDYLNELLRRYGDESSVSISAPPRPDWCLTNSDDEDEPNKRVVATGGRKRTRDNNGFQPENKRMREESRNSNPQFAVTLPGVTPICSQDTMKTIQSKCQQMCDWNRDSFPGSQPVSMDITNYVTIVESPYMVSWKADGTRYLMLIEDRHKIYMFDRDNNVFEISHLEFPKDGDYTSHLTNTLVDGELVIDNVNGTKVPRYLIYDIIVYENKKVGGKPFKERLDIIRRSIVGVRHKAIEKTLVDRSLDPFSIRIKDFWELSSVHKLLDPEFRKGLSHEMDGLIFQPEPDPYRPGRSPRILKWKEDNTIDFLLKIDQYNPGIGQLPEKVARLHFFGSNEMFPIRYTRELRQYDNKIIECSLRNNEWHFVRHRIDKSFPNARETVYGTMNAIRNPVTKEMLCSLIDKHLNRSA